MTIYKEGKETKHSFNNWDSTLYKRGFEHIIAEFIEAVRTNKSPSLTANDALKTHELCEEVVKRLECLKDKHT
ncbi:hypothetical protein [Neobacillus sp. FSL H8-0543]|uniref:hypothetical protein n=1 Tax=Neobacillus sp. FSL H8-0543 TaxID=2954672 RepID=UPI0031593132